MHQNLRPFSILYNSLIKSCKQKIFLEVAPYKAISFDVFKAPELYFEGGARSNKSDIWSMGVMVYILLSGEAPFRNQAEVQ